MLSNLSMKNKLLFTVLPLTLVIYLATVLLVYLSSKASTEELAEVAVDAIARQQASEISSYFDASLYSMRNTAGLLGSEILDGELPDRRIADQMIESLFVGLPEASAIWWIPGNNAADASVLWLRSANGLNPALDEQREALVNVLRAHVSGHEQAIPLVPISTSNGEQKVIALTVPVRNDGKSVWLH
jgi:methyl-accepting chemotaxis protein